MRDKKTCNEHLNLVIEVKEARKDIENMQKGINWLIEDRHFQKTRAEERENKKRIARQWRIGLLATGFLSMVGLVFGIREDVRLWLNWWIHR